MASAQTVQHFELISLGTGEAGKYIAWTVSNVQHKRCAAIERKWYGGSCPNVACLPSKNVIWSAKVAQLYSRGQTFGLSTVQSIPGEETVSMHAVKQRKDDMIAGLMQLHRQNFEKSGTEVVWGDGKFVGPKMLEVTDADGCIRTFTADTVVISTGSRAAIPNIGGLQDASPLTHVEVLELEKLPEHLIIIGAGYVGLEFAQAFRRLGAKVTIIDTHDRIVKREDDDVACLLYDILTAEGMSTKILGVAGKSGDWVQLRATTSGKEVDIVGSHILVATGRLPNTDGISLDVAGVATGERGHIKVDEQARTTAEGVFAVGDCAGTPHFTHVAFDDFRIVRDVLLGKPDVANRRSARQVPYVLFTDPELAHIGLHEHEAKAQGLQYRLAKVPMLAFLRTRTSGETQGFAKALIARDDTIIGFTAVGAGVGELLPVVQLVMKKRLPYTEIAELVITHPTLSEGLVALFSAVAPRQAPEFGAT